MANKVIAVAAGIICRNGQLFLTQRALSGHQGGKWEFPGGKVESNESPRQALTRELQEEVGIDVRVATEYMHLTHEYPDKTVGLTFFMVTDFAGEPRGCEGQRGAWFEFQQLTGLDFPAANLAVVEALLADR